MPLCQHCEMDAGPVSLAIFWRDRETRSLYTTHRPGATAINLKVCWICMPDAQAKICDGCHEKFDPAKLMPAAEGQLKVCEECNKVAAALFADRQRTAA
jgi:hypothetical protein